MARSSVGTSFNLSHLFELLKMYESAQARKPAADVRADAVEQALRVRVKRGFVEEHSPDHANARMLAGKVRMLGTIEYHDFEVVATLVKAARFLFRDPTAKAL